MFTGLIQKTGRLQKIEFQRGAGKLTLSADFGVSLQIGESIAINGTCLTLVEQQGSLLTFDVLRETLDKTALGGKPVGALLNLERALRMGEALGGHLVSGHTDGTGEVLRIETAGRDKVLVVNAPPLIPEMVPKGSVAIDGISLTLVEVQPASGSFSVHVIPHTWEQTALASLSAGDRVNLETDMIGKYVRANLSTQTPTRSVTWKALQDAGFLA